MKHGSESASYRNAGVDIDRAEHAKARIARLAAELAHPSVIGGIGHFGGFFRLPPSDRPLVLVSSADSVGTKVLLANAVGAHHGIGVDLVNHCVNDVLTTGARPLFFLDYYATPKLDADALVALVEGLSDACAAAGCALVGGETAQLPGVYREDAYDVAGFLVGGVEEDRLVDGSAVRAGDAIVGLPSSGLHTNGFSLARAVFELEGSPQEIRALLSEQLPWSDRSLGDILLEPHRSYLSAVLPLLDEGIVHGMAHITGGGLGGNVARIIPGGLQARIEVGSWPVPKIFDEIRRRGHIDEAEMFRVFNMGIGFVLIVPQRALGKVLATDQGAALIGAVVAGESAERVQLAGLEPGA